MTEDEMVGWHHGLNGWEFQECYEDPRKALPSGVLAEGKGNRELYDTYPESFP